MPLASLVQSIQMPVQPITRPKPMTILDDRRVQYMSHSYVCRRVPRNHIATLLCEDLEPQAGDLILVRVLKIGRFDFIESSDLSVMPICEGQELIVCYAPVQSNHDSIGVKDTSERRYQLLNPAGIASRSESRADLSNQATEIEYVGILANTRGQQINIGHWAIPVGTGNYVSQPVIAVIGERNLPGEACRSADMIRGLSQSGFTVGAANITGVPGCWKVGLLRKSGAKLAVDITDAGFIGVTGLGTAALEQIFLSLSGYLADARVDIMVLEIEQGVFGHDTAGIISLSCFHNRITSIVLEGRIGRETELERDALRALGYNVTLVDIPASCKQYAALSYDTHN